MVYTYVVRTSMSRNFEPDVEGATLDSIAQTCKDYVTHSVPFDKDPTIIQLTLSKPLDQEGEKYLIGQLEVEFGDGVKKVVLGIRKLS
jgi:hypothetical protein